LKSARTNLSVISSKINWSVNSAAGVQLFEEDFSVLVFGDRRLQQCFMIVSGKIDRCRVGVRDQEAGQQEILNK
jgi:hypothetical protein